MQPDSIIPNPANPQNWNRYSYVINRPINFNDPTGHLACQGTRWDDGPQCFGSTREERLARLNITIDEDMPDEYIGAIIAAAIDEGGYYAASTGRSAEQTFREQHDHLTIIYDPNCENCRNVTACGNQMSGTVQYNGQTISCTPGGAHTDGAHQITIASMSAHPDARVINIVHEFGHVFNNLNAGTPVTDLSQRHPNFITNRSQILFPNGDYILWQQNTTPSGSETFADLYVAQIYGVWNTTPTGNVDLIIDAQDWMDDLP